MKKLVYIIIFLLCCSSISFAFNRDGNELLTTINKYLHKENIKELSHIEKIQTTYVFGLIKGISFSFALHDVYYKEKNINCTTVQTMKPIQHVRIIQKFLEEHPALLTGSDSMLIWLALKTACKNIPPNN